MDLALTSMILDRCVEARVSKGDIGRGQGADERYFLPVSARYKNQAGRIFRADEVQPRKRITVSRALRAKQKYKGFSGIRTLDL